MTRQEIALGGVVSLAMAAVALFAILTIGRSPAPAVGLLSGIGQAPPDAWKNMPQNIQAKPRKPFDEMWLDAGLAIKSDRLGPAPKLVRTVMVVPDAMMPPDPPKRKPVVKPKRTKTVERDVCRGKGKAYINGGPAWRCKG